jgi:hypothetical protein
MIGRIEIPIPIRLAIAGISFLRKRSVGFAFTNHAVLLMAESLGKEVDELREWMNHNQTLYLVELLYSAYVAHCRENYARPKISKKQLIEGWVSLPEEEQRKVIVVWEKSLGYGAKPMPGAKKKQKMNRR